MTKGTDHPDYVHEGATPYVIDGTADLTTEEFERENSSGSLLWIVIGVAFGASLFLLGRWSA